MASLGSQAVCLALLLIALLANAAFQRHQSLKLARQIVGLIFELREHIGEQHGAADDGEGIVAAGDQRRRRRPAHPLHGAQHFDDDCPSLGDRALNDVHLFRECGKLGFGLGKLCLARLYFLAGLDQLDAQSRLFLGPRGEVLGQPLFPRAARLQLLLGLAQALLRVVAGQIHFCVRQNRHDAKHPDKEQGGSRHLS